MIVNINLPNQKRLNARPKSLYPDRSPKEATRVMFPKPDTVFTERHYFQTTKMVVHVSINAMHGETINVVFHDDSQLAVLKKTPREKTCSGRDDRTEKTTAILNNDPP